MRTLWVASLEHEGESAEHTVAPGEFSLPSSLFHSHELPDVHVNREECDMTCW